MPAAQVVDLPVAAIPAASGGSHRIQQIVNVQYIPYLQPVAIHSDWLAAKAE